MGKTLCRAPAFPRLNVKHPVIFKLHPSVCLAYFEDDLFFVLHVEMLNTAILGHGALYVESASNK